jgi:catechol 2,3-dioxygenase-like lactoylglutathione lyase family enzyme
MTDWREPGDQPSGRAAFEDVAPVLPVRDLAAALERYRRLGFRVRAYGHGTGYGYAERGSVTLHLSAWDEHDPLRTGSQVYLFVADADAVHAEWTASGVEGRFTEPGDTEYGLREFAFVDTDGTLHRVGSPLARTGLSARGPAVGTVRA